MTDEASGTDSDRDTSSSPLPDSSLLAQPVLDINPKEPRKTGCVWMCVHHLMVEQQVSALAFDKGGLLEGPPGPRGQHLPGGFLQRPAAPLLQLVLALPEHLPHLHCHRPCIILRFSITRVPLVCWH